jgi:hypothetical protein
VKVNPILSAEFTLSLNPYDEVLYLGENASYISIENITVGWFAGATLRLWARFDRGNGRLLYLWYGLGGRMQVFLLETCTMYFEGDD